MSRKPVSYKAAGGATVTATFDCVEHDGLEFYLLGCNGCGDVCPDVAAGRETATEVAKKHARRCTAVPAK